MPNKTNTHQKFATKSQFSLSLSLSLSLSAIFSPMDLDLKQWRDHHSQPTSDHPTRIPRMESYFSSSQWQELELQALIFRHMSAGADIPPELLHLVKKSLISSSPFYHYYYPHFHPSHRSVLQSGYWGRAGAAMDPEPGRCRRTDGKKWRCSRDVVAAQKYCDRHMHRGKNRSRKPVENPTSAAGEALRTTSSLGRQVSVGGGADPPHFTLSVPSHSSDLLHLNQSSMPNPIVRAKGLFDSDNDSQKTLHFFDDWPKSLQETNNGASSTNLSISMPENPSSDFSLKLGTGDGGEPSERDKPQLNWGVMWGANPVNSMGGPLAEVLRSSTSNLSLTNVLHRNPRHVPASDDLRY